jgi:hypothetical protein
MIEGMNELSNGRDSSLDVTNSCKLKSVKVE